MAAMPNRYRIVDSARLAYEVATTEQRGAPALPPAAVEKLLQGFRVEHSFVLQHGVHEYVASRKRWYRQEIGKRFHPPGFRMQAFRMQSDPLASEAKNSVSDEHGGTCILHPVSGVSGAV